MCHIVIILLTDVRLAQCAALCASAADAAAPFITFMQRDMTDVQEYAPGIPECALVMPNKRPVYNAMCLSHNHTCASYVNVT